MVANKDTTLRRSVKALEREVKDPGVRFTDAFGFGVSGHPIIPSCGHRNLPTPVA
jgi:hypothetical protein